MDMQADPGLLCLHYASCYFQLIATTALYLASKTEDAHVSLRDIINVSYR